MEGLAVNYLKSCKVPMETNGVWFSSAVSEAFPLACAIKKNTKLLFDFVWLDHSHLWRWDHVREVLKYAEANNNEGKIKEILKSPQGLMIFNSMTEENRKKESEWLKSQSIVGNVASSIPEYSS
jgi:hypothetical protein